ncbi:MAG TPA: DUF4019 domain-containing protein [Haliangium sp.]|nr:DUF4019 domain-containing protein [Haliangium sp.]
MQGSETDGAGRDSQPRAATQGGVPGPRRTRRRRLLVSGLIVACALVFGWIGVIVVLQMVSGDGGVSLREETHQVLEAVTTGRADEVYTQAAPRLREHVTRARFLDVAQQLRASLGQFRDIVAIRPAERFTGPSGRTARVRVTAEFDNGRAGGQLSYHLIDGRWLLLGFGLNPIGRDGQEIEIGLRPGPLSAPPDVLAAVREILALTGKNDATAIHAMAAQSFRDTIGLDELTRVLAMRSKVLGDFVEIREVLESQQNRARTRSMVKARVAFRKRETEVVMRFLYIDQAWRLTFYIVELPRPDIPATAPEDLF